MLLVQKIVAAMNMATSQWRLNSRLEELCSYVIDGFKRAKRSEL